MKRGRFFSLCFVLALLVILLLSGCGGAEPTPAASSDSSEPPSVSALSESDPVPAPAADIPSAQSFSGGRLQVSNAEEQEGFAFVLYEYEGDRVFQQEYIKLIEENYPFVLRAYLADSADDPNEDHEYAFDYTGEKDVPGFDTAEYLFGRTLEDVELHVSFSYWKDAAPTVYVKYSTGLVYGAADEDTGHSEEAQPVSEAEPEPSQAPVLPEDDVTLPSIQSFANYKLEPEGDRDKDGYMILYYDLKRNDTFTREYIDLLTEHYHFSLRSSGLYREGVDKYLDGAEVYHFDYTGTAPIVGFTEKATDVDGVHDVDLVVIAKKTGFVVKFADGLVWTETDDRSTVFGGSEPQYPSGGGGYSDSDRDDDDRKPRRCAVCGGSGEVDCSSCGGSGEKDCVSCSGRGYTEEYVSTPNYSGKGSSSSRERVRCLSCGGDGEDDCYSCRGHGTKDCTSCGGDGER